MNPSAIVGEPSGPALSGAELDTRTMEVASLLRCPTCQGLSVADSHAEGAVAIRGQTKELLAQGYDEEQVLMYFEASYGEFIRLEPTVEGINLLVWILPIAFVLVGLIAWYRQPRRKERVVPEHLGDYVERVRRETS